MWRKFLSALGIQKPGKTSLALESENQALLLELEETQKKLSTVQSELLRRQEQQAEGIKARVEANMEALYADLCGPLAQLGTQVYLDEVENKSLRAADVLRVVKSLLRILQNRDLCFFGEIGSSLNFDPNYHNPIGPEGEFPVGTPVCVRMPGISYHDKVLLKAGVRLVKTAGNPGQPQE